MIEKRIAAQLGLTPIRFEPMIGVSQKPEMCPVYLMSVNIFVGDDGGPATKAVTFGAEVIGMSSPPKPQQHAGLLGRDFLSHMKLVYDGPHGAFELIPEVPAGAAPARPTPAGGASARPTPIDKSKAKGKRKEARRARKRNRRR